MIITDEKYFEKYLQENVNAADIFIPDETMDEKENGKKSREIMCISIIEIIKL